MCKTPIISVIVPVYKVEPYLRRCVDSILKQGFKDFELILVDDGSPDKCGEICDEYANQDVRVVVIHQQNGGLSAARNAGLDWVFANSKSEYIGFIDSDDWVAPNYLEELYKGCQICDIACVDALLVKSEGRHSAKPSTSAIWDIVPPYFYYRCASLPMTAWGKLFRRDVLKTVRFPNGKIHEDEYVIPYLLFSCRQIATSNIQLYYYFRRDDSIMGIGFTEKHLSLIDALVGQIDFFAKNGLDVLVRNTKISLGYCYSKAILKMQKTGYRPKLRELLGELQLPTLQYQYFYKAAYPFTAGALLPIERIVDLCVRKGFCGLLSCIVHRIVAKSSLYLESRKTISRCL